MSQLLREIAEIGAGQGAPQGDSSYCSDGIPFVKAGNMESLTSGGSLNDIQKVAEDIAKAHKLKLYPKGTILFAKSGMSCLKGYVYVLPQEAYVVSHLACITPKEEISEYLRYYFGYHKPNQLVKDAAYPSISLADIGALAIDLKDEDARKHIISSLQAIEGIIKLRNKELQYLDELIKARFVEMFGDPRRNPYGYKKRKLKETCAVITGNTPSRSVSDYYGDYIEWIKTDNIVSGTTNPTKATESLSEMGSNVGRIVEKNAILMACIAGSIASIGRVCITNRRVAFNQQINAIVPKYYNVYFLYVLLQLSKEYLVEEINMALKGILSKSKLEDKTFYVPPIELQNEFASFVEQVDKSKLS